MKQDNTRINYILLIIGIIPIIWLALLVAPYINGGIMGIVKGFPIAINNPLNITYCENSIKTILLFMLIYGLAIGIYFSTKRNYRRGEEHGSAKWGIADQINKKYEQKPLSENKILTQNVKLGLNGKKHRRNLNVLVCGR